MEDDAGLELDALVAEKVMGWQMVCDDCGDGVDSTGTPNECPKFSSDIAAAWEVVEKLKPTHRQVVIDRHRGEDLQEEQWGVAFVTNTGVSIFRERAPTAPLAICKAALKAVSK